MSKARGPVTVLVPAHDEEQVVGRTLRRLLGEAEPGELDVVVVCNGCTDGTAVVARDTAAELGHQVRVVETPIASKAGAIRLGERLLGDGFPRVYLDADVECPTATVRALAEAVRQGAALAAPRRVLDLSGATRTARLYYVTWQDLPWVQRQLAGRGVYAISTELRSRFSQFPDLVADDRYVAAQARAGEAVLTSAPVVVRPPSTARAVLSVRSRIYAGNAAAPVATHDLGACERAAGLLVRAAREPRRWPSLGVFLSITCLSKLKSRGGTPSWGRDAYRGSAA